MGRILTIARSDAHRILTSLGFETPVTFHEDDEDIVVNGLTPVHHISFDTDGNTVNSKNAHISISEKALTDAGVTVRNGDNEVYLRNRIVSFADSTGTAKTYVVKENYADESLGVIVLNLGKYAE